MTHDREPVAPASPWLVDRSVGLPIGTRVWNGRPGSAARFGTVMHHQPECSGGSFPVRWDHDQVWASMDVTYVTAVSPEQEAAICAQREPRAARKATVLRRQAS